jgi:hypothetical protein
MSFQGSCHPESTYPEKAPTAQLTRIYAADRLFFLPLTRITSVPECAVSSVGFLWGPATVWRTCGGSVGPLVDTSTCLANDMGAHVLQLLAAGAHSPGNPALPGGAICHEVIPTPADSEQLTVASGVQGAARRSSRPERLLMQVFAVDATPSRGPGSGSRSR